MRRIRELQILPIAPRSPFVTLKQQGIDGVDLTAYFPIRARNIVAVVAKFLGK